jgi:hypothetical protein
MGNSVAKIGNNEIPSLLLVGIGIFGLVVINKTINKGSEIINKTGSTLIDVGTGVLETVGLKESEKHKEDVKKSFSRYFLPNYWKIKGNTPDGTILLNYAKRISLAKDLYKLSSSFHVFSMVSDYDRILAIFKQLPSKVSISQLADSYYTVCKKDLANSMQTTLTENEFHTLIQFLETLS